MAPAEAPAANLMDLENGEGLEMQPLTAEERFQPATLSSQETAFLGGTAQLPAADGGEGQCAPAYPDLPQQDGTYDVLVGSNRPVASPRTIVTLRPGDPKPR